MFHKIKNARFQANRTTLLNCVIHTYLKTTVDIFTDSMRLASIADNHQIQTISYVIRNAD